MINELHPPEQNLHINMVWHWRKHRAERALRKIFKDDLYWAMQFARDKAKKCNNLEEINFWNNVSIEISGFNCESKWYDKYEL